MDEILSLAKSTPSNIYLAPYNIPNELLSLELTLADIKSRGFVDNYKVGLNIFHSSTLASQGDLTFLVNSDNYWHDICKTLPGNRIYIVCLLNGSYTLIPYRGIRTVFDLFKLKLPFNIRFLLRKSILWFSSFINLFTCFKGSKKISREMLQKPKRGFVVCNGPSLNIDELSLIREEVSIACNKAYLAFPETDWRPTFYTIQDQLVMKNLSNKIRDITDTNLVLPCYHLKKHRSFKGAYYFNTQTKTQALKRDTLFSNDPIGKGLTLGNTTLFLMIQFLASIDCKEIYILGADFDYKLPENAINTTYIANNAVNNHFSQDYRPKNEVWTAPRYKEMFLEADSIFREALALGVKIINLTPKSKLNAFPKDSLENVLGHSNSE